jgi:hypothetical protein
VLALVRYRTDWCSRGVIAQAHDLVRDTLRERQAHLAGKLVVDVRLADDVNLADTG